MNPARAIGSAVRAGALLAALCAVACGGPRVSQTADFDPPPTVDSRAYAAYLGAQRAQAAGRWDEAADLLRDAIHVDPTAWRLHLELAETLVRVPGALDEGTMACDLASDLGAPAADVAIARARLFATTGRTAEGLEVFRGVPPGEGSAAMFREWLVLAEAEGPEARIEAARAWTTALAGDAEAWRELGDALHESAPGEAADAFAMATRLPDPDPNDALRRIQLLVSLDRSSEALDAAADCRVRFWEYWPCTAWQAMLLDAGAEGDEPVDEPTLEALRHLAFMASIDGRALSASGWELNRNARRELVSAYARVVAEGRPDNAAVLSSAAWIANNVEDYDLAVDLMERVLTVDDANFDALNYIGYTWAEQGRNLDQAEVYIREALFLRGDDGNILDSLAWVYFRMGRYEEALEVQRRAIDLVADNAVLWDHLGDIYRALDRYDEALDAWRRALDLAGPYDEDVLDDAPAKIEELERLRVD